MFKRRHKPSFLQRLRHSLWPRSGWKRSLTYGWRRLLRLSGTPNSIAASFACGVVVGLSPFWGFHAILVLALVWLLRGNIISGFLGSFIGNPWTMFFIMWWTYELGAWMMGSRFGGYDLSSGMRMDTIFSHPLDILLPMTIGFIPPAIVLGGIAFFTVRRIVSSHQVNRRHRLAAIRAGHHHKPGKKH